MLESFHIAAQYLTTVAISFLEKKEDDSHTNLGWNNGSLTTHNLNEEGVTLSLEYRSFSLSWSSGVSLYLDGKSHSEILQWIQQTCQNQGLKGEYSYNLHFELPYTAITDDFIFTKPTDEQIGTLISNRDLAHDVMSEVLDSNISVRVWPHHFDSGAFFMANENLGIGLGMAIPDAMISDFYLYVSGYIGHAFADLDQTIQIKYGKYYSDGWKGFALPLHGITKEDAISFFSESINIYIQLTE